MRLGHAARDAPGVAVLVEVTHEGAVGKVELLSLAQPTAEFFDSPVGVVGKGRVVDNGQDAGGDGFASKFARPARSRTIDQPVDPHAVETFHPEADGAFAPSAVAHDMREGDADEQRVDGLEAPHGLAVGRTVHGRHRSLRWGSSQGLADDADVKSAMME